MTSKSSRIGAFVALLLVPLAAHAPTSLAQPSAQVGLGGEQTQAYYLEATSPTTGPFLSTDKAASATTSFVLATDAQAVLATSGAIRDVKPAPISFEAVSRPLKTEWLNLSKQITVYLYWSTTVSAAGGSDGGRVRVELFSGARFVGGDEKNLEPGPFGISPTLNMSVSFFPEVRSFEPSEKLLLKVFHYGSLSGASIGTGGTAQSVLRYAYYNQDPLASALYLQGGQLIAGNEAGSPDSAPSDPPVASAPAPEDGPSQGTRPALNLPSVIAIAGLAMLGATRRSRAALLFLLLLSGALAGCVGSRPTATTPSPSDSAATQAPQPTIETHVEHNQTLEDQGTVSVQGIVRDGDHALVPMPDVDVGLLGTKFYARTKTDGRFAFNDVPAGAYKFRADAEGYNFFEGPLALAAGDRVTLNVTLTRPGVIESGDRAHRHDLWGEETVLELFSLSVLPRTSQSTNVAGKSFATLQNGWITTNNGFTTMSSDDYRPRHSVVPQGSILVLPGTIELEVLLAWNPEPAFPVREVALSLVPANAKPPAPYISALPTRDYLARGPGQAFHVPIFPNEADSGHQKFTQWDFAVVMPTPGGNFAPPAFATGPITMTVKIHKGVVPFEPPHRDFWNGTSELPLVNVLGSSRIYSPQAGYPLVVGAKFPNHDFFAIPTGNFVPPETTEIRGNFSWAETPAGGSNLGTAPAPNKWVLAYQTADMNPKADVWKHATMTYTGPRSATFVIKVLANETDQYYQSRSFWSFSPDTFDDDPLHPHAWINDGVAINWRIDSRVVRPGGVYVPVVIPPPPKYDETEKLYLRAAGPTTDPHLTTKSASNGVEGYMARSAAAALGDTAASSMGTRPPAVSFATRDPLSEKRWLNLSTTLELRLYLHIAPAGQPITAPASVRMEVLTGTRLIGGGEYELNAMNPSRIPPTGGSYYSIAYTYFHPEVQALEAGEKLIVNLYFPASLGETWVLTSGSSYTDSYLAYHYFTRDPLAGALYLENGRLTLPPEPGAPGPEPTESSAAGLVALVGLAGLAIPRRPNRSFGLLALFLLLAFSGCTGARPDAKPGDTAASASVDLRREQNDTLAKAGVGAVHGTVRDAETTLAIRDARVALGGTSISDRTDAKGRFRFDNVTANTFTLLVNAPNYEPLERVILVEAGIRLTMNISLLPSAVAESNEKQHRHDLWDGELVKDLFAVDVVPTSYPVDTSSTGKAVGGPVYTSWGIVKLPNGIIVLPGTNRIEITLGWTADPATGPSELGLQVTTPASQYGSRNYVPRAQGKPFNVVFFPNEADSGHEKFTRWTFTVTMPPSVNNGRLFGEPLYTIGSIHVVAKIHKGVVPYEPPHEDFWKGADRLPLIGSRTGPVGGSFVPSTTLPLAPTGAWPNPNAFVPDQGRLVPPDAKFIRGNFSYAYQNGAYAGSTWVLAYRPANVIPQGGGWKYATMKADGTNRFTFEIAIEAGEGDEFYHKVSYWRFSPDTRDDDALAAYGQVSTSHPLLGPYFTIDATVFRA